MERLQTVLEWYHEIPMSNRPQESDNRNVAVCQHESYAEMVEQGRNIGQAVSISVIGDGDTGYGNHVNVKRTVRGYATPVSPAS